MERHVRVALIAARLATGGIKSYLLGLIPGLQKRGYDFEIFAFEGFDESVVDSFASYGVDVVSYPSAKKPLQLVESLTSLLKAGDYDIAHGLMNSLNPFGMISAWRAAVPVRIAENLSTGHCKEAKSAIKAALKPFATVGSTDLLANSQLAADWLYGRKSDRCSIINNPVDLGYYRQDKADRLRVRSELGLASSFVLGWIGRFDYQKNPLFLIDVLAATLKREPSTKLLVVGYGPLEADFMARSEELEVADAIIMLGKTEDIRPFYRAMDCFILPSLYEGLPIVAIEAQSVGVPCVLSTEITREAAVSSQVSFASLDDGASTWADSALSFQGVSFEDNSAALKKRGFGREEAVINLELVYRRALIREGIFHE